MISKIFFIVFLIIFSNSKCQEGVSFDTNDGLCFSDEPHFSKEECNDMGTENPKFSCCMVEVGGVPFCLAIINSKTSFQTFRNSEEGLKC